MSKLSRREFAAGLAAGVGGTAVLAAEVNNPAREPRSLQRAGSGPAKRPIVLASGNGYQFGATQTAYEKLVAGADTLDAVIAGVNHNEDDPNDDTVGYGGLPNELGVVQLDSCVMHGPSNRCGAVGALENCKNASLVAKAVMDHTDEIFLVGAGASQFAKDYGFEQVDMLTEHARKTWLLWRETRSLRDSWGPGLDSPDFRKQVVAKARRLGLDAAQRERALNRILFPPTGTINCLGVNAKGEISGVTTTSGMAFKIPGRVGDSPIIGAGLFVDGEVGGGGSTGRGEENIRVCGGHTLVELMRQGKHPREAVLEVLERVAHNFRPFPDRLKSFDLSFYALRVDGAYAAGTLWDRPLGAKEPRQFAVHDGVNRLENMLYLKRREG